MSTTVVRALPAATEALPVLVDIEVAGLDRRINDQLAQVWTHHPNHLGRMHAGIRSRRPISNTLCSLLRRYHRAYHLP
jgi:hypothetical protein